MADNHHNPGGSLPPNPPTSQDFSQGLNIRLGEFEHELFKLVCCHHFYHDAMQTLLEREMPLPDTQDRRWYYGVFVINEWLNRSGDQLLGQLENVKAWAKQAPAP